MGKTAVVTGANQGLGLALVARLARTLGDDAHVYLTGRDATAVSAARDDLARAGLRVLTERVDVRRTEDVEALAERVRERHGVADVVISNAAARIAPDRSATEQVREFIDTNNLGTTRMLRAFRPVLADDGSFLVVASSFGTLRGLAPSLHQRFDTNTVSLDALDATMLGYADAVRSGRAEDEGWPDWINIPSKVGQVAAMRVVAREEAAWRDGAGPLVAAVCPGLLDTAASRPWFADMSGARSPGEGAVEIVDLALAGGDRRFHGELVRQGTVVPWT